MTNYYLRTIVAIGAPLIGVSSLMGAYLIAYEILPAWWFQTDACPQSELACGQPAPVTFLLAGILILVVATFAGSYKIYRRFQTDV